jgi:hypothetical protein
MTATVVLAMVATVGALGVDPKDLISHSVYKPFLLIAAQRRTVM